MEKHFNENAFGPVSYENLRHLAVGEVGGANLGAATMMLAAVLRSPPDCHESWPSSDLLTRLMTESFLSTRGPNFRIGKIQCTITNTCQVSIPHHPPLFYPLPSSTEPHYDPIRNPLMIIVSTQDPSHCGNFSEITDS